MANFLTDRKYNERNNVFVNDADSYYYNNRKHNVRSNVYVNDAATYYYNNRKYNTAAVGVNFQVVPGPDAEEINRAAYYLHSSPRNE